MSSNDSRLHPLALYRDDNPEESETLRDERFSSALLNLCPSLGQQAQSGVASAVRSAAGNSEGDPSPSQVQTTLPSTVETNHAGNSPGLGEKGGVDVESERRERTEGIALPPKPSSQREAEPKGNTLSSLSKGSQRSSQKKRKRPGLLVKDYFAEVLVKKRDKPNEFSTKHMCENCLTVVGLSSRVLLQHIGTCPRTSIFAKKDSLDQSRDKSKPNLSLDVNQCPQREAVDKAKQRDRSREVQDALETGRPIEEISPQRRGKKRNLSETSGPRKSRRTGSRKVGKASCDQLRMKVIKAIVAHNLPFTICDREDRYPSEFIEMLEAWNPDNQHCIPNSTSLRGKYLDMFYDEIRGQMVENIERALGGMHGHATIMFDGWEDVNGQAVINVMLRLMTSFQVTSQTYLLDSVYTKDKKVNAEKYVEIIEEVLSRLLKKNSSSFLGINGVVSDSAQACVNAKLLLANKYPGVVTIQDQAHAADLLMGDLGKLPWLQVVLAKVGSVVQISKNNRKLYARLQDLIASYNEKAANGETCLMWRVLSDEDVEELAESVKLSEWQTQAGLRSSTVGSAQAGRETQQRSESAPALVSIEPVKPTAVTLKKQAKTRFASAETMLEGYLRSRQVLIELVSQPDFSSLYDGSTSAAREKCDEEFVGVVKDDMFYKHVIEVHNILRVLRRYLRIWDAEGCQVSEVAPATILLERSLRNLPESAFLTPERKQDVLGLFERRCVGGTAYGRSAVKVRILEDVHYAAWLLDPILSPARVKPFLPAFRRHVLVYLRGNKEVATEAELQKKADKIVSSFKRVHKDWEEKKKTRENAEILEKFTGQPLRYWDDETPSKNADLLAFASATLSLCPSSCATERSFSYQGRIHTKQRNRLRPEMVRKLLFCKWNGRVFKTVRRLKRPTKQDEGYPYILLMKGALKPFEDFTLPFSSSAVTDEQSRELERVVLLSQTRVQSEIEQERTLLYQSTGVWTKERLENWSAPAVRAGAKPSSPSCGGSQEGRGTRETTAVDNLSSTPSSLHANSRAELQQLVTVTRNLNFAGYHAQDPNTPKLTANEQSGEPEDLKISGAEPMRAHTSAGVHRELEQRGGPASQVPREQQFGTSTDKTTITIPVHLARELLHNPRLAQNEGAQMSRSFFPRRDQMEDVYSPMPISAAFPSGSIGYLGQEYRQGQINGSAGLPHQHGWPQYSTQGMTYRVPYGQCQPASAFEEARTQEENEKEQADRSTPHS